MNRTQRLAKVLAAWGTSEPSEEAFEIPIEQLIMTKEEIAQAVSNLSRGLPSMTEGPLQVHQNEATGRYHLTNGYHRVVETLMSGSEQVIVQNQGKVSWRTPSDQEIFTPDWDEDFYGMEEFIEYYELKNL